MSDTKAFTVTVSNLSPSTSQATLEHFFSFCGKIQSIDQDGSTAKVHFVKESSCKTALMLTGGTLEGSQITVSSDDTQTPSAATASAPPATSTEKEELEQEDKPHAAKIAEYLASGYQLSDQVVEKAIQADQRYGISNKFLSYFSPLATKIQEGAKPHVDAAATKLAAVDEKQGLSLKVSAASIIGSKYYNLALSSPFGSRVHQFYTQTSKQVLDVHEEARRIAAETKKSGTTTSSSTSSLAGGPTGPAVPGVNSADIPAATHEPVTPSLPSTGAQSATHPPAPATS